MLSFFVVMAAVRVLLQRRQKVQAPTLCASTGPGGRLRTKVSYEPASPNVLLGGRFFLAPKDVQTCCEQRECTLPARVSKQGRLLTLQAVTCMLAWNARRAKSGRDGGGLDQEGMQEDLVGMFRRAFESGLQTVRKLSEVAPRPCWSGCCPTLT